MHLTRNPLAGALAVSILDSLLGPCPRFDVALAFLVDVVLVMAQISEVDFIPILAAESAWNFLAEGVTVTWLTSGISPKS